MVGMITSFLRDRRGATAIEYGLIAAIIASALIVGLGGFSDQLTIVFDTIKNAIVNAGAA